MTESKTSFIAARPGWFVALAVMAGIGLLSAALFWDRVPTRAERRSRISDAIDVVSPGPLTDEETASGGAGIRQERVSLESGAWVQVADEHGRLEQRYRAQRIDPEPDRWMRMEQPIAVMFPRVDRVVTMRADHGRARVPKRAIQAGRLTGNVEIRLYRGREGEPIVFAEGQPDLPIGNPAMIIRTDEAQFDEVLGEIRCDGWVDITAEEERVEAGVEETRTISFKGEGLSITVDPQERSIERLTVERALTPIRITRVGGAPKSADASGARDSRTALVEAPAMPATSSAAGPALASGAPSAPGESTIASASTTSAAIATSVPPDGVPTRAASTGTDAAAPAGAAVPSAGSAVAAPAPSGSVQARVYRLTLHDDVVIHRVENDRENFVRGDRLVALFSLEGSGLRDAFASLAPPVPSLASGFVFDDFPSHRSTAALGISPFLAAPWPARLALLALASLPPESQGSAAKDEPTETITIRFAGRMVLAPMEDPQEALASPDDLKLIVESIERGGRGFVEIEDVRSLAVARCDRLVYRGEEQMVDLEGSTRQPLEVRSPQLTLEGGRFQFDQRRGEGVIPGRGTMRLGDQAKPVPAAEGAKASGQRPPDPVRDLQITWTDRLDIALEDESKGSQIKSAQFRGDVKVDHADFGLASQGLLVQFQPGAKGGDEVVPRRILADGGARAERLSNAGSLSARIIDVDLGEDAKGRPVPTQMKARGDVTAKDRTQTLWSDDLQVVFEPRLNADGDGAAPPPVLRPGDLGGEMGDVEVTRVLAGTLPELRSDDEPSEGERPDRGVQILLRDGARVFARRLDGNARERRVKLEGPDVMIVQKNVIADQLQHLDIDEAKGTVTAIGPGRFRQFREPVVDGAETPRERPQATGKVAVDATWTERMKFDDRANRGGGALDLEGNVRVRASRSDREYSALDARTVQLDMRNDANATAAAPAGDGAAPAAEAGLFASGTRTIERFIAKGDARLESQTWQSDAREGEPRLFVVTGDHVEYHTLTGRAEVIGQGSLLVHDTAGRADAGMGGTDARGTSRFRWGSSMTMVPLSPGSQQFVITMNDGVELKRAGLRPDDTLTLTCRTLETTILRPGFGTDAEQATPADANAGSLARSAEIDLGGPAELLRVVGRGQVMVGAPDADIECEEFDYDVRTQIAQMRARDGRLVSVLRRDSPTPLRATSVLWDRTTGRMTIQSGSGAIGR